MEKPEQQDVHKNSACFLASIINSSNDCIEALSLEGTVLFWNKSSEQLYGYSSQEIIGKSILIVSPEDRLDELPCVLSRIKKGQRIEPYVTIRKGKDGKLIEIAASPSPIKDTKGKLIGVSMITRFPFVGQERITQYVRALIEASLDPLVSLDPEGKIIDVNKATVAAIGVPKKNMVGTDFSNYFTDPKEATKKFKEVIKKGIVTDCPLTIKHFGGRLLDVLYSSTSYKDLNGHVVAVFATARDITTTQQAMQYSRSIIEASLDPLVIINPQGKITDANNAMVHVTGYDLDTLIDSDFSDYITEPEKARESYKLVFSQGNITDYPLTIRHRNGQLTEVLYNASVYKDINGNVLGVAAAARDITKQKQASQYARSLIEASLDPLITISPEGKITDINEAATLITGCSKEVLIGSDFFIYFTEPEKAKVLPQSTLLRKIILRSGWQPLISRFYDPHCQANKWFTLLESPR